MASIDLHISAGTAQEFANALLGVIGTIGHLSRQAAPAGANAHGIGPDTDAGPNPEYRTEEAEQTTANPSPAADAQVTAEAEDKPKRTRRTKAEMEAARAAEAKTEPVEQTMETEQAAPAEQVAEIEVKAEPVPDAEVKAAPITNEELWAKLDILIKQASTDTAARLLHKYGHRKIRDLTEEQRPVFLEEINKAIAIIESTKGDPEKNAAEIKKALKLD